VSQQVAGQTKASMRQAKQIEARLLEEVGAGRHKGSRSRTMAELLERWLEWRATVRPVASTTVSSYRAAMDRYILPALGRLPVRQVDAVHPPQAEDATRLLSAAVAEDPELGLFLRLAVMLSARRGELCGLRGRPSTLTAARC
jgi:integrase